MAQRVLLLGATGHTGNSILNGLLEYGRYEVTALVRPSSTESAKVKTLVERGVRTVAADVTAPVEELTIILREFDVVISAIDAVSMHLQRNLVFAAKQADVKRFVPCAFISVCPPGGVLDMRDEKEIIYQEIRKLHLPYTIIDVGVWHQVFFPTLPSGRADYASVFVPNTTIHAGGDTPNLMTDLRDIGPFVARIIADPRTVNQSVYTWSDMLSENEIFAMIEDMSGETIDRTYLSAEEIEATIARVRGIIRNDPNNLPVRLTLVPLQYNLTRAVRGDNQGVYAKSLGYLDARELYPDFKPRSFKSFVEEVLDGKAERAYKENSAVFEQLKKGMVEMGVTL